MHYMMIAFRCDDRIHHRTFRVERWKRIGSISGGCRKTVERQSCEKLCGPATKALDLLVDVLFTYALQIHWPLPMEGVLSVECRCEVTHT